MINTFAASARTFSRRWHAPPPLMAFSSPSHSELVHVPKDEVGGNDELFRLEPYSEGISVSKPLKEEDEEMMNEGIPDKGIMEDGIVEV
jgi:hypothetical protein